ncbi:hypothetical protein HNQ39_002940 [Armatimonas rosea]|uniref:Uncharacterized protein n=1 Tax=Armatimonas rosea TaxID=685828 RepID=A0A7W9SSF5_ARMRO|nr:hypothetical protein [Armatimonas rosea]
MIAPVQIAPVGGGRLAVLVPRTQRPPAIWALSALRVGAGDDSKTLPFMGAITTGAI